MNNRHGAHSSFQPKVEESHCRLPEGNVRSMDMRVSLSRPNRMRMEILVRLMISAKTQRQCSLPFEHYRPKARFHVHMMLSLL